MIAHLHQTVSAPGAYEILRLLEASSVTAFEGEQLHQMMVQVGVEDPTKTVQDFLASNLLRRYGERFGLTSLGIRTCLLLEAINGGDLKEVYRRLCQLDTTLQSYELVQEGMTRLFLRNLNDRPGFRRLYVCSPWISLDRQQQDMLTHAVVRAERRNATPPEVLVITRPEPASDYAVPATLRVFQDLGAKIFLHKRLHTKLYIREPDVSGGYAMAILGSQNLTKSTYIELGIRINSDGQMIDQLIRYFWQLSNSSHEV